MLRRTNWLIPVAAIVALAGLAPADTVKLKSGLAMESVTIEGFDGNTITVGLGRLLMAVKLQDVESIQLTGKADFNKAELLRAEQPAKARQEYLKEGAGAPAWLQKLIAARLTGLPEEPPVATRPAVASAPTVTPTPTATVVSPAVVSNTVGQPAIASRPSAATAPVVPLKPANPYASPETLVEWMKTTLTSPDTSKMTTIQREAAMQEYDSAKAKWMATHDPRGKDVSWRIEVQDVGKAGKNIVLSGKSKGGTTVRANFPTAKTSSLVNISKGQNVILTGQVEAVQQGGDGGEDEACIVLQGKLVKAE